MLSLCVSRKHSRRHHQWQQQTVNTTQDLRTGDFWLAGGNLSWCHAADNGATIAAVIVLCLSPSEIICSSAWQQQRREVAGLAVEGREKLLCSSQSGNKVDTVQEFESWLQKITRDMQKFSSIFDRTT